MLSLILPTVENGGAVSAMINIRRSVVFAWNYTFNHEVSPLRHIDDVAIRHYVLQALGFMWAVSSCVALGSYTVLAASIVGHAVLVAAAAVTVATYTAATVRPALFRSNRGRRPDGEERRARDRCLLVPSDEVPDGRDEGDVEVLEEGAARGHDPTIHVI